MDLLNSFHMYLFAVGNVDLNCTMYSVDGNAFINHYRRNVKISYGIIIEKSRVNRI